MNGHYLVISALGKDRPGIVNQLTEPVSQCGCNILDSRMTVLGGEFAVLMLVTGQWSAIAQLEEQLPDYQTPLELTIVTKRTEQESEPATVAPYSISVVCLDHPGIINQLTSFLASKEINIHDLDTGSYRAPHTGTQMFNANLIVHIPVDDSIAQLREEFFDFCDSMNLDATLDPLT